MAVHQRINHRRRKLWPVRHIGNGGGQSLRAGIAIDPQRTADFDPRHKRLGHIKPQLDPAIGQQRQHGCRWPRNLAGVANNVGNHPIHRCGKLSLVQAPFRAGQIRLGAAQSSLGSGNFLRAGGKLCHRKIGLDLCRLCLGGGKCGGGIVLLGLGGGALVGQVADPVGVALGLGGLGAGRDERGLNDANFLGPLAFTQIGKLAFGTRGRGLGLRQRDFGVLLFHFNQNLARLDMIATRNRKAGNLGGAYRSKQNIFALGITGRKGWQWQAGGKQRRDKRDRANEHGQGLSAAARRASRVPSSVWVICAVSVGPMFGQPRRRVTMGAPTRK